MICIVGGGASGMMAGIAAARSGGKVLLLERNPRLGKKLLATGNGRCNFTNSEIRLENYHGQDPAFALGALRRFPPHKTLEFFASLGVVPVTEAAGRVFPASNQAGSIVDVLRWELEALGVQVRTEAQVQEIRRGREFTVVLADDEIKAEKVILATGGKAHPQSGSDGKGLELAKSLGHRIIAPRPALVQLQLGKVYPQLQGIKVHAEIQLLARRRQIASRKGEILFTNYGLSGLPALALSRQAGELLAQGEEPVLSLNFAPDFSEKDLLEALSLRQLNQPRRPLERFFAGWLPNKLGETLIRAAGLASTAPASSLTSQQRRSLGKLIKAWRFPVTGLLGWQQAQVTAGGVDVSQVDSTTMESKVVKNLYFAGEILDIDGDSGGYNLQWAWSSGFLAGSEAARKN